MGKEEKKKERRKKGKEGVKWGEKVPIWELNQRLSAL